MAPEVAVRSLLLVAFVLLCACRRAESNADPAPSGSIVIAAGTFSMGCPGGDNRCDEIEGIAPPHPVTLCAFAIDRTEVTQGAYLACVEAGRCSPAGCGAGWPCAITP
jgi:formylglycine-generating enzyme required for sulfatase activity